MTFLSAETGWKEKVDWKRTNELEVIFGFQLATIQNPRNQFFMRTVQLLQGTTHLQLQAVHVIFTKERERKKQLSLKVNTSWTAKNIISKTTVDHLKKKKDNFSWSTEEDETRLEQKRCCLAALWASLTWMWATETDPHTPAKTSRLRPPPAALLPPAGGRHSYGRQENIPIKLEDF